MTINEIAGYELEIPPLRVGICTSFKAQKDGKNFFVKLYRYDEADSVTADRHYQNQERVRGLLNDIGNISEKIVEHGALKGFGDDPGKQPDAYYQVKPWCEGDDGGQCIDLQDYINNIHRRIYEEEAPSFGGIEGQVSELITCCFYIAGLMRQCHARRLVHQDLKPEQFLMVPFSGEGGRKFRPVIADFDWSFLEGEEPLKKVGTLDYHSPEHLRDESRTTASDVFTLAVIVFKVLGFNRHPLLTDDEEADFLTPEQRIDLFRRCEMKRSLKEIYLNSFADVEVGEIRDGLSRLDGVIAKCLSPTPAGRPKADDLWSALNELRSHSRESSREDVKDGGGPPKKGDGSENTWFRLRVDGNADMFWTIRATVGGTPGQLTLDREIAKRVFGELADSDGNPFYKYLEPARPSLVFLYEGGQWLVQVPEGNKNTFVLRRNGKEDLLVGGPREIQMGDRLVLYSRRLESIQEGCEVTICPE